MIHHDSKLEFDKYLFPGANVVELGDQMCDFEAKTQGERTDTYFKRHGVNITSIDWHGNNRALKLDLSKEIKDAAFESDILTDFGTLEHVKDLYFGLLNCFNFVKTGGIMIHVNPDKTYSKHGYHYFTTEFWKKFAKACNYEILSLYKKPPYDITNPALEVYCTLRKKGDSKMCSEKEFEKLKKYIGNNE